MSQDTRADHSSGYSYSKMIGTFFRRLRQRFRNKVDSDRLSAAIASLQERLEACQDRELGRKDEWWAKSADRLLGAATLALDEDAIDKGWSAVQEADRTLIYGMDDGELVARALSIESEVGKKLGDGWRGKPVDALFDAVTPKDWLKASAKLTKKQRMLLQRVAVEALVLLHDYHRNTYHRIRIVRTQLTYLVVICAVILLAAFGLSAGLAPHSDEFGPGILVAIAISGALGGVVSAMYQLSRSGKAKIPEALLHGLVTSGRPLVGAGAALFVYVVMKSDLLGFIKKEHVSNLAGLALGFVAGFSEDFVLQMVAKVAGLGDDAKADGGKDAKLPKGQKDRPKADGDKDAKLPKRRKKRPKAPVTTSPGTAKPPTAPSN